MNVETLFALCACALVGIGLYGLIVLAHPLRKLVAFNIMGTGVFVLFGALARRGVGEALDGSLVDTRARCSGKVDVPLLLRLIEATGTASLADEPPAAQ